MAPAGDIRAPPGTYSIIFWIEIPVSKLWSTLCYVTFKGTLGFNGLKQEYSPR